MRVEPYGEGSMGLPQGLDTAGVLDRRLDLEPVADNAWIGEQPVNVGGSERRHAVDLEISKGGTKSGSFLEDCNPGRPA